MSATTDPSALEGALRVAGVECAVEAYDRLAVIVPHGASNLADPARRKAALELATRYGFTHLAVELVGTSDDRGSGGRGRAAVCRD